MRFTLLILAAVLTAVFSTSAFAHGEPTGDSPKSGSHSRSYDHVGSSGHGSSSRGSSSRWRHGSSSSHSDSSSSSKREYCKRCKKWRRHRCKCKCSKCPNGPLVGLWENYGEGLAGCNGVPGLTMNNRPVIGTNPEIVLGNEGPATQCALFWSWQPAETYIDLLGGNLLVAAPFITVGSYEVPCGGFTFVCSIPDLCPSVGVELYLQTVCLDPCGPEGFSMSRGMRLLIGDR